MLHLVLFILSTEAKLGFAHICETKFYSKKTLRKKKKPEELTHTHNLSCLVTHFFAKPWITKQESRPPSANFVSQIGKDAILKNENVFSSKKKNTFSSSFLIFPMFQVFWFFARKTHNGG